MTTYALLTLQILSAMAFAFALQLFSRGSLAVVNQLSTRSENDGAEHAHLQGKCLEFVSRFLYSICEVMRGRGDR